MKPRDIDLVLKIKNFKAGKFLHLYITEALAMFQRAHPRIVPHLLTSLKGGNPRLSLKHAKELEETAEILLSSAKELVKYVEDYMVIELPEKVEDQGDQYINTDGGIGVSFVQGEESVSIKTADTKEVKKKPAKKRATKKKTKKEE